MAVKKESELSLYECVKIYIEYCESHAQSPRTIQSKRHSLMRFVRWCEVSGISSPSDVTLMLFESYSLFLCRYRKPRDGEPLAIATRRLILTAVREFFRRLYYLEIISSHPLVKFELPKSPRPLPKEIFTVNEIENIIQQTDVYGIKGIRDKAIIEVLFATGIRTCELAKLKMSDIDLNRREITVTKGKGGKDRILPIAPRAIDAINHYLNISRPKLSHLDSGTSLFLSNRGKAYSPNKLSRLVSRYVKRSGVKKLGSCKKFRHATATLMLENGADIRIIQEMMGHEDISTTQIYTRVSSKSLRETYERTHPAAKS